MDQFKEEGRASDLKVVSKFTTVLDEIVGDKNNKKYQIGIVGGKIGEKDILCREKRSGGLNTFCLNTDYKINHRNGSAPKINVNDNDILVLKGNKVVSISLRYLAKRMNPEILMD